MVKCNNCGCIWREDELAACWFCKGTDVEPYYKVTGRPKLQQGGQQIVLFDDEESHEVDDVPGDWL